MTIMAGDLRKPPLPLRAAAWVPSTDPHRVGIEVADLAAQWILEQSRAEGTPPVVVTSTLNIALPICLRGIAGAGSRAAPQVPGRSVRGPVVAYVPDARTLSYAIDFARGHSLVAIEGCYSIASWAAAMGAVNLVDNWRPSVRLPPEVLTDLNYALTVGGINGWAGLRQQQHAGGRLARHIRSGALTPDDAATYVVSRGVSDRSAQRLRALLKALNQHVR